MHRFFVFAGICLWLVSVAGCGGGDDSTPVASNDAASSGDETNSEAYDEDGGDSGEESGGDEEESGGSRARRNSDDESGGSDDEESGSDDEESGDSEEEMARQNRVDDPEGSGSRGEDGEDANYGEEESEEESSYEEEMANEARYEEEMEEEDYGDGDSDGDGDGSGSRGGNGEDEGYGDGRPGAGQPARPLTLAEKSQAAFAEGRDGEAFQYLYAHAVTADDATATELLGKMGLLVPAKRPALAVRWGVGIEYIAPKDYKGSAYPIGTSQSNVGTGNRSGGGRSGAEGGRASGEYGEEGGDYGSGPMARGGATDPQLKQLTGELGEKLVAGLRERIEKGGFGKALADATSGGSGRRPAAGGSGYGSGGYEDGYGEETEDGGYGQPRGPQRTGDRDPEGPVQLTPGVVFLGVADAKTLKEQAKKAELDVLCIFEVNVKFNVRLGTIINETTIGVYNVLDDRRPGHETKKINNIQVQVARTAGDEDVTEAEMEKLFEYVDSTWQMTDLPESLTEQAVLDRLRPLITEPQANPLPVLAEIRMYRTRGLLKDENFAIACKSLLGDQAATALATGAEEAKSQAIEKWLPTEG